MSKIYLESISYDQNENNEKSKLKSNTPYKSHRKTTSALVRNADAALYDITNSPPPSNSKYSTPLSPVTPKQTSLSPKQTSIRSTPLKSSNTPNNNHINFLDNTSLSPKSSRYTISHTPTKRELITSSTATGSSSSSNQPTMMTLTQSSQTQTQPQPSPVVSAAKNFFTPTKPSKLKKKQMEKEIETLKEKIRIMEKVRIEADNDADKMKMALIEALSENERLQNKVSNLEVTVSSMKKELDKGSYEAWKGYCSLQDSPPGNSSRYSKKRALGSAINPANY